MNVYKFGGASIATPARMKALLSIVADGGGPLLLVVSAYGKTTNALEAIIHAACRGNKDEARQLAATLEAAHLAYAAEAAPGDEALTAALHEHLTELHWAIDDAEPSRYDYWYDQMVCVGELLSTRILAACLSAAGVAAQWCDARDLIRTDDTYRDARVDETATQQQISATLKPMLAQGGVVVTQGFIGSTPDMTAVTLGREGSDYSAALLAAMLGATRVTIWKDVPGLLSADPREYAAEATLLPAITYREVIEMAYYGAQVIHPKTIKPLQNGGIPLHVRCFENPALPGTVISEGGPDAYPPLIIRKQKQVLLQATSRDFSFITEEGLAIIYRAFAQHRIRINLIQNAAIAFVACVDCDDEKIAALRTLLDNDFIIRRNEDAELLTIRHHDPAILDRLIGERKVLLRQETRQTAQVVTVEL